MVALTDQELVLRSVSGNREAYGDLVERYQTAVFNVCLRLTSEKMAAEDLAQETFVRAFSRLTSFDRDRPFGPWIKRIASNLCINALKRLEPDSFDLEETAREPSPRSSEQPEAALDESERSRLIRRAIAGLPAPYRAVIELRHFEELDYQAMARILNLPVNTVRTHLSRARAALAKALIREDI